MLIDSHCHLASHRFSASEVPEILHRAEEAGVARFVTLSTGLDDLDANLAMAMDPRVHTCIGIHPCDVHSAPDDVVSRLACHVGDPRICGIGETGLDYFHAAPEGWEEEAFRERQRNLLDQHFELAASAGLNVVIHTRDREGRASFEDALEIYRRHHSHTRAVFHCFIGSPEEAQRVMALGGILSFGGVCTFKNAREPRESAVNCPAGSFMLETDSPYLAPEPHRGKRNEPCHVADVARFLAPLRGESIHDLAGHTTATACSFFRFRPGSF